MKLPIKLKYQLLQHGIVWLIFFYLNIRYLQNWLPTIGVHKSLGELVLYSIFYLPLLFSVPYLHYFFLLPRYFFSKKYGWYIIGLLFSFVAGSLATAVWDTIFLRNDNQSWLLTEVHIWSRIPLMGLFTLLAIWARMAGEVSTQQKKSKELEQKQTEAELRWLKAQINPHFLFNALNNIHSLVHLKNDEAGPMIVKLAEMMRYMLQESDGQKLALKQEIHYMENYIRLHSLKQRWISKIKFQVSGETDGIMIEPLLFINFVENAFKHSNLDEEGGFILIHLKVKDHIIYFDSCNSFGINARKDSAHGIGLENTRQRLQLLYPGKHQLNVEEKKGNFGVSLQIRID